LDLAVLLAIVFYDMEGMRYKKSWGDFVSYLHNLRIFVRMSLPSGHSVMVIKPLVSLLNSTWSALSFYFTANKRSYERERCKCIILRIIKRLYMEWTL